jgi:type IV pilus assembly protein PilW
MKAKGMGLVELMLALAIGAFLVSGAVSVYVSSSRVYAINESIARMQEAARLALDTLEHDVRLAGFWGLTSQALHIRGAIGHAPLSLSARGVRCGADFVLDLRRPLHAANNAYPLPCAASGGGAAAGTDTLMVRHADVETARADGERLQLYTSRGGELDALFLAGSPPGPLTDDPALGPEAEVRNLVAHAYYIARDANGQTRLPALRRKTLRGGASGPNIGDQEIMPGVEDLQVQFGIDPGMDEDGDGVPDDRDGDGDGRPDHYSGIAARYVDPGDPALENARVVAARVWIRVRAETPETGYHDGKVYAYADVSFHPAGAAAAYRRLLISRTIRLRNATWP